MIHSMRDVAKSMFLVAEKLKEVAEKNVERFSLVRIQGELYVSTSFVDELIKLYYRSGGRRLTSTEIASLQ